MNFEVPMRYFKHQERGLRFFRDVSGEFSDNFSHFSCLFRIELEHRRGQFRSAHAIFVLNRTSSLSVSFCRRATLTLSFYIFCAPEVLVMKFCGQPASVIYDVKKTSAHSSHKFG